MPTALITGASRGIGAAVAKRLAQDGFDVAIHYHRDQQGAEATATAARALGRQATTMQADMGDPEQAWSLAARAQAALGDVSCFVNNAGLYDRTGLADMTGQQWRKTMGVNLDGPAALSQALLPQLQAVGDASVIHMSSIVAVRGSAHGAHYAASKAALLGLTRAQALEWAPIRVNAICPGYIDTDMIGSDTPERRATREQEVPLGRVGKPDDVAGAVSFLAGPDSAYVTGQTLHVNGGLWMG